MMRNNIFLIAVIIAIAFFLGNPLVNAQEVMMNVSSPAFAHNTIIPQKYTCQGEDINPALTISDIPEGTVSLALIIDDPDAPLPAELRERARERVAWADAQATTPAERQAVVNRAWYVLIAAGLDEEAGVLLAAEIERSDQPYYFMLNLSKLAQRAGREDEAIAWLARAYDEAEGPATRFQWGYNYVVGLLEMTPEDGPGIERATIGILGELDDPDNVLYNRTSRRLGLLGDRLVAWNDGGEFDPEITRIRARAGEICEGIPAAETARATCDHFLAVTCGDAPPGAGADAADGPSRC